MSGPVVVGVDGSQAGMAAVEAAAREADRNGVELRLAHALEWSSAQVPPGVAPWDQGGAGACRVVRGALAEAEGWAVRVAPQLRVTHEVLMGSPVTVLESESRKASLVVVGSRPPGRSGPSRSGSVAGQLAAQGCSPVLVVRGRQNPTGPVVLAGGRTQGFRAATEFAYAEASTRGTDLVVLDRTTTWNSRSHDGFADALSVLGEKYPDVTVHRARVRVRGGLCRALTQVSTRAQLVVVGSRNRGRLAGALPSPVCWTALHHADCPVAVICS